MRNFSYKNSRENRSTHFISENRAFHDVMRKKCGRTKQAADYNIIRYIKDAIFEPDSYGENTDTNSEYVMADYNIIRYIKGAIFEPDSYGENTDTHSEYVTTDYNIIRCIKDAIFSWIAMVRIQTHTQNM